MAVGRASAIADVRLSTSIFLLTASVQPFADGNGKRPLPTQMDLYFRTRCCHWT
jgi:hypothetical protein